MKNWFDNWNVTIRPYTNQIYYFLQDANGIRKKKFKNPQKRNGRYVVDLPNSYGKKKHILITKTLHDDNRIRELVNALDSALYTLSRIAERSWLERLLSRNFRRK